MKSVSVHTMREMDRKAVHDYGIPGIILMENAGLRSADIIMEWYSRSVSKSSIIIVCGTGNNGGDGFVIARHLLNRGFSVRIFIIGTPEKIKGDALTNLTILKRMEADIEICADRVTDVFQKSLNECDFIVDAIFGTGLDREVREPHRAFITRITMSQKPVVAIDAPSGLDCEKGIPLGAAVKAWFTITMACAKDGFFRGQASEYTGALHIADISFPRALMDSLR